MGFRPVHVKPKTIINGICCYIALRSKNKGWMARNRDNVSEWGDMSTEALFFSVRKHYKKNGTMHVGLVQIGQHHHLIEM
jgi:hypothetical protein